MSICKLHINGRLPSSFLLLLLINFFPIRVSGQVGWQSVSSGVVNPYDSYGDYLMASYGNIIYAAIGTLVYKWDGNGWTALGTGPVLPFSSSSQINKVITDAAGNVYAAGWFTDANGNYYVAKWDGHSWNEVGTGGNASPFFSSISTIAADGAGNIYATGQFTNTIGQSYIAKWNGSSWSELKSNSSALNANSDIRCITTDSAGNVYAAGDFTDANNKKYIAKWNGSQWSEVGTGPGALNANSIISSIVTLPNGNIYASGFFTDASGHLYIAKWNGASWSALPYVPSSYMYYTLINNLHADAAGNIYTGGSFTDQSGYVYVAKWDGATWSELGSGIKGSNGGGNITSLAFDSNGNMYTAGSFKNSSGLCYVAELNKATNSWGEVGVNGSGELPSIDDCVVVSPNKIYALQKLYGFGGLFEWNGDYWSYVQSPPIVHQYSTQINSIVGDNKGNLYLSGSVDFDTLFFCKWDGTQWTRLDTIAGFSQKNHMAGFDKMIADRNGNVYGIGNISTDSGIIVKWDGSAFTEIKYQKYYYDALNQWPLISAIALDTIGNLYAGLYIAAYDNRGRTGYCVAKWDGNNWVKLGTSASAPFTDRVYALATDKEANIYASVNWYDRATYTPFTGIQKWNGTEWVVIDTALDIFGYDKAIATDGNNNLYATGAKYWNSYNVRQYSASGWHELGTNTTSLNANGNVTWIGSDNFGNIYAFGAFTHTAGKNYLARYGTNGVLPIKFLDFMGYLNKGNAILNWQTATEINADHFNVERSIDGVHFATVGKVMALGNSASVANYSFTDPLAALDPSVLKIYYRLAAVDKDGATTYTNIVRLVINETNSKWSFGIYPVPVKNILQLQLFNTTGNSTVSIFDAQGKMVVVQEIDKLNAATTPVNVSALSHGLYFLQVLNNGERKTVKFIK